MTPAAKAATPFAKRGWLLFPARWDGENHKPYVRWSVESSCEQGMIEKWSTWWPEAYFCVNLKASGLVVLDPDNKNGKNGSKLLADMCNNGNGPLPPTMRSLTPNKGEHIFFIGDCARGVGKLGPGIDIPHMVPLPGQTAAGKGEYKLIERGQPADLPQWIINKVGVPIPKDENVGIPISEPDQPHHIKAAIWYLKNEAKEAVAHSIEGGDNTTFQLFCDLKDLNVTEQTAVQLAAEHWNNTKAHPPWPTTGLQEKAYNAYRYGKKRQGCGTPEAVFDTEQKTGALKYFTSLKELRDREIKVDYALKPHLEKDTVNVWFGEYAHMKTFVALHACVVKASGGMWVGQQIAPGPVVYLAGEGHGGLQRRFEAICKQFGIDKSEDLPVLISNQAFPFTDAAVVDMLLDDLAPWIEQHGDPSLVFIDTLIAHSGGADDNSSKDMKLFLDNVQRLRRKLGSAVTILHHPGHGDKNRSRGSYNIEASVDGVFKISRDGDHVCLHEPKKMKDGEPPKDCWFESEIINLGVDDDLNPITSLALNYDPGFEPTAKAVRLGKDQQLILDLIPSEGISMLELRNEFKRAKDGVYHKQNFRRILTSLREKRLVKGESEMLLKYF